MLQREKGRGKKGKGRKRKREESCAEGNEGRKKDEGRETKKRRRTYIFPRKFKKKITKIP